MLSQAVEGLWGGVSPKSGCGLSGLSLGSCGIAVTVPSLSGARGMLGAQPMRLPTGAAGQGLEPASHLSPCSSPARLGHSHLQPFLPPTRPRGLSMLMASSGLHGDDLCLGLLGDNYTYDRLQFIFLPQMHSKFSFSHRAMPGIPKLPFNFSNAWPKETRYSKREREGLTGKKENSSDRAVSSVVVQMAQKGT